MMMYYQRLTVSIEFTLTNLNSNKTLQFFLQQPDTITSLNVKDSPLYLKLYI